MKNCCRPLRPEHLWVLYLPAAILWVAGVSGRMHAAELPVVALLAEQRTELPWIDLVENALASDAQISLVDREHVDIVLEEQKLALLMGPANGAGRMKVGKLVGCDVLIILRHEPEPNSIVRVVIADTRTGIRLVNAEFPARFLAEKQQLPPELLTTALTKRAIARPIILAIPPFANDDLSRNNRFLQSSLAAVCESVAAHYPRILLVELDEARELARESAISARETRRPLPHYLIGRFRLESGNAQQPPLVAIRLERGNKSLAERSSQSPTLENIGAVVKQASTELLASLAGQKEDARTDNSADAATLAKQSLEFMTISDFEEGTRLAEASLLLRSDQPDLRHSLSSIYLKLAALQYDDPRMSKERFDRQFQKALSYAERGMQHLQIYLNTTKFDPLKKNLWGADLTHFRIHGHSDAEIRAALLKHERDVREMFVETLLAKARKGEDAPHGLLSPALGYYHKEEDSPFKEYMKNRLRLVGAAGKAPAQRQHLYNEILTHGILPDTDPEIMVFYESLLGSPDPELVAAARRAIAWGNRISGRAPAVANRARKLPLSERSPGTEPTVDSDVHVQLKPIQIDYLNQGRQTQLSFLQGILSDERDNEVAWGFHRERAVLLRHGKQPFQKIFETDNQQSFGDGCYDGKYVWIPVSGSAARVLRIDPINGAIVEVTAKHGLPDVKFVHPITVALQPGRIVLIAGFGPHNATRAFVAEIVCQQKKTPHVRVVHEAREESIDLNLQKVIADRNANTKIAYLPKFVLPLRDKENSAPTRILIGRSVPGIAGEAMSLVVDLPSGEATISPVAVNSHILSQHVVFHDDAAYWLANNKVWRVASEKTERQEVADIAEDHGALYFVENGIVIVGHHFWFSEDWSKPFRRISSDPEMLINTHLHSALHSKHFGPLLKASQQDWKIYQVEIARNGQPAK